MTVEISDEPPPPPPEGWESVRMDRPFRVFRNWRMIGEGCPWEPDEPFEYAFMIVDGTTLCRVCSQERKPRKDT